MLYIKELVRFHGVPIPIISDHGIQFTSHFWQSSQKGLGTKVNLSTTFHPQINGQAEDNSNFGMHVEGLCIGI